jgi:transposase
MTGKRKRYSADFKARVSVDAIRGEQTLAQLAAKHGIHQTMIIAWKKQAIEGMAGVFSGTADAADTARAGEIDQLHAKIGQLLISCEI